MVIAHVEWSTGDMTFLEARMRTFYKGWLAAAALATASLVGCGGGGSGANAGGGGPTLYTVGGATSGLSGTLTLQNNGADDLVVSANGAFTFASAAATGSAYNVTVLHQPAGQTCTVANGSGTVASVNVTNVSLSCGASAQPTGLRVGAGYNYTMAVRADGSVVAWGQGMDGGSGTALAGTVGAKLISGLITMSAVRPGPNYRDTSLAIAADGTVFAWGYLRDFFDSATNLSYSDAPITVGLLGHATQLALCAGSDVQNLTYALRADGSIAYVPATKVQVIIGGRTVTADTVTGLGQVVSMSQQCTSDAPTVAAPHPAARLTVVRSDGTVWTLTPSFTSATTSTTITTTTAIAASQVTGLPPIASVSCAGEGALPYCLGLAADGHVWAWGDNTEGQLGDGTATPRTVPIQVPGLASIAQVAAGLGTGFAVATDGTAYSWGGLATQVNGLGRLINGDRWTPKPITLRAKVAWLSASSSHVMAQLSDGSVWGWGSTAQGALGANTVGPSQDLPVQAVGIDLN
jgi:alpha-tubulin suppressor-like RCC1 family protein